MKKQKKNGLKLLFYGMVTGALLGLAVLWAKHIIATQLIGLLQDELSAVTDCELVFDDIHISFLSLRAKGTNARVVCEDKDYLSFQRLVADFSLNRIHKYEIDLVHLLLERGHADGVLGDSPTFKFIDRLTESSEPGSEPLIKLRLMSLQLEDATFVEHTSIGDLWADSISMLVLRTPEDNFALKPQIGNLRFEIPARISSTGRNSPPKSLRIGGATTQIIIFDDLADFRSLLISLGKSTAEFNMKSVFDDEYALDGSLDFDVDSFSLDFPEWINTHFTGSGELKGEIDNPGFSGSISFQDNPPTAYVLNSVPLFKLNQGNARFDFDFNHGTPKLNIPSAQASGNGSFLKLKSPLSLLGSKFHSSLTGSIKEVDYNGLIFHNVDFDLDVDGEIDALRSRATGRASHVSFGSYSTPSVKFDIEEFDGTLSYDVQQIIDGRRSLALEGSLDLMQPTATINELLLFFDEFSILPDESDTPLKLSGKGSLAGPLNLPDLSGSANIRLSSNHFEGEAALRGTATLKNKELNFAVSNQSQSLSLKLNSKLLPNQKSLLDVNLNGFNLKEYNPDLDCIEASMSSRYEFSYTDPKSGNGTLQLTELNLGCAPYTLRMTEAINIPVKEGNFIIPKLSLRGKGSSLNLNGSFSLSDGYNLESDGNLSLSTLAILTPTLDDLRGTVDASIQIHGPTSAPIVTGFARIDKGELSVEAARISVTDVNGTIEIDEQKVQLTEMQGQLNGGHFFVDGAVYPFDFSASSLHMQLDNSFIDPFPDVSGVVSGSVKLHASEDTGDAMFTGELTVESAELIKKFDVASLLQTIPDLFVLTAPETVKDSQNQANIALDIAVNIPRDTRITTNYGEAELTGRVHVTGSVSTPQIEGKLSTLQGWIGFRDRRFVITTGQVTFPANAIEPQVELLAESTLRSREGDSVLVILEASGALSSPEVVLTSDRGHSEQEILDLISASGNVGLTYSQYGLQSDRSILEESDSIEALLRGIASIDSLSIEPAFNYQRGLVEPSLIARKYITPSFSLIGQSFFTNGDSALILRYDLFPAVRLLGSAQTVQAEDNSPLGVDLAYTIFSSERPYLEISIQGNSELSDSELLTALRLNSQSRLQVKRLDKISKAAKEHYAALGFRSASVLAFCPIGDKHCHHLILDVSEGKQSKVAELSIKGTFPSSVIDKLRLQKKTIREAATESLLKSIAKQCLSNLRSEGFIAARVSAQYQNMANADPLKQKMILNLHAGDPVSFIFEGNRAFSAEDFLDTINLFSRKQPFGNNTIRILIENMERLYRNSGYLFATILFDESKNQETKRRTYNILINEEQRVSVDLVHWALEDEELKQKLYQLVKEKLSLDIRERILNPTYAVAETLEENTRVLQALLEQEGYTSPQVSFQIIPRTDSLELVDVLYSINPGTRVVADWLDVQDWPKDLDLPPEPITPYSIPAANQYTTLLLSKLHENGYLQASFSSSSDSEGNSLKVVIEPGPQTLISDVYVIGNRSIDEDVIVSNLSFRAGHAWKTSRIRESRRKLLQLGLFSRVEIAPSDGELNSELETVVVKVLEKPLQSMDIGGGLNSEYGIHFFGEAIDRGIFSDGKTLALRFDTFYDDQKADIDRGIASLRYTDPDLLGSGLVLSEDLRFVRLDLSTYEFNLDRVAFSSTAYRSWADGLTIDFGHTILDERLDDVSPDVIIGEHDQDKVRLSYFSNSISYDGRDNPLLPTRGVYLSANTAFATEGIGSDANYFMAGGKSSFLLPLDSAVDRRLLLALNSHIRIAEPLGSTDQIPITQRFYLGGQRTVRGFRENSLGPRGELGGVLGGDFSILGNLELRYRVLNSLSLHAFYDTGNVFLLDDDFSFGELRRSAGLGLRYLSPIGPIGFDIGHPLDERAGEPSLRVHFAIGTVF